MAEDRRRSVVADVRSNLLEFYPEDDEIVTLGVKIASNLPVGADSSFPPNQIAKTILVSYPDLDRAVASNIALAMCKAGKDKKGVPGWESSKTIKSSKVSFQLSHCYQAKGKHAKSSEVDMTLPRQLESSQLEELWGGHHKWESCVLLKSMEDALETLQPQICSSKQCFFYYEVVGTKRSVVGTLKPDVIIKLRGSFVLEHASIGAILSLHSSAAAVQTMLMWLLVAEPASLGLLMKWRSALPEGCTIKGYLGSGKTSTVYEVDCGGRRKMLCIKSFKKWVQRGLS